MNDPDTRAATFYLYRNKSWLPENVGRHFFIHWLPTGNDTKANTFWIVNNSFSGGYYGIYNARQSEIQLLPKLYLLNNIFSSKVVFYCQNNGMSFYQNKTAMGGFDHNWLGTGGQCTDAAWYGANNISKTDYFWPESNISFDIQSHPEVKDKGVDISIPFTVGDIAYPALAQIEGYSFEGSTPDLGAIEIASEMIPPSDLKILD